MSAGRAQSACARCGVELDAGARFCGGCGAAVAPTESSATLAAPGAAPDLSGRVIAGRYRLGARLGEGGMGAVYRAEQISLKRPVAIKLLKPELSAEPGLVRRFNAEAELAAKLTHPNTVTLFDFGQDADGSLFIAMELLSGHSLRDVITGGPLPVPRALAICQQITASLADAHAHGIVHRDLKPDNVMLCEQGRRTDVVKVLDFGIAKLRDERNEGAPAPVTRAGDLLGTPQYMAPEQIRGDAVDARTDVYALGAVVYEMLTGRLPFEAPTVMGILSKHLTEMPPAPSQRRPDLAIPRAVDQLVMECLQKDPALRPATMEAFAERLAHIQSTLTTGPGLGFAPTQPRTRTRPPGVPISVPLPMPPPLSPPPGPPVSPVPYAPGPVQTPHPGAAGWTPPPVAAAPSRAPLYLALGLLLVGGIATAVFFATRGGGDDRKTAAGGDKEPPPGPGPGAPPDPGGKLPFPGEPPYAPQGEVTGTRWTHPSYGFSILLPPGFVEGPPLGPQIVQFLRTGNGITEAIFVSSETLAVQVTEEMLQAAINQTMVSMLGGTLVDSVYRTIQGQRRLSAIYDFAANGTRVQLVVYLWGQNAITVGFSAPQQSFIGTAALRSELFENRVILPGS